ncbi:MAG TPA: hypothetical protein DCX25_02035 [Candidatus Pacebacteria bacterium]|nr:MAG: Ribulose-phosphate 3-epimerase [Microgenomates group bacterium GW2011_GWB1_45_17]KKU23149.1 MAG: Ribulose-phosphate 3-epimerase [Microgenomates group bacterium GW2011_GWA1_46_15]KKU23812.1 MAG: Ribulose-phosphate 3-epimerase [Microgenomates group bacterium GW2011_GWC1_46_15]HAV15085.1 hypothetical protein [Candidatus Paceibacterota bacterium]HCR11656.1 hypothetical protein [Candidatus Paceibacterota bacterium]
MYNMNIYPTILTDSLKLAQHQINLVAGEVSVIQLDIMDGEFVDNITCTPVDAQTLDWKGLSIDVHLQTVDPINDVVECQELRGMRTVIAQVERMSSQAAFIEHVKSFGWRVGLSLDLYTPLVAVDTESWKNIDVLQIMTIHAGFQGEKFEESALEKIQHAKQKKIAESLSFEISVDGGIRPETALLCKKAGAESLAVGSFLWKAQDIYEALHQLTVLS